MTFAKIDEVLEMPNLIDMQKSSYEWFIKEGLREAFRDVSPITDYAGNLILEFTDYRIDEQPSTTQAGRDLTEDSLMDKGAKLLRKV